MRTPTDVCVLALEMRRDGVMASIRPMDCCFHPMDRPILPLEISLHGHFSVENWPRFAHIVAKKALTAVFAGGPCVFMPQRQAVLIFAYLRARARLVENIRFSVLKSSAADGFCPRRARVVAEGQGYFIASSTLRAASEPFSAARRSQYSARPSSCVTPSP